MTLEEAKTKVCPIMSNWISVGMSLSEFKETTCIGEPCMFWENTTPKEIVEGKTIFKIYPTPEPSGHCNKTKNKS